MSQEEQDAIVVRTFEERAEAIKLLACHRLQAKKIAQSFRKAANALEQEDDALYADLADRALIDKAEETWSGIRRNKNLVRELEAKLDALVPSWRSAPQ